MARVSWFYNLLPRSAYGAKDVWSGPSWPLCRFRDPVFLLLHGGPGAPWGCVSPADAAYWRRVEQEHQVDVVVRSESGATVEWHDVAPDHPSVVYARTRWYPFALNGMEVLADLSFALGEGLPEPVLEVRNSFGLLDLCYQGHTDTTPEGEKIEPTVAEWSERARRLLGRDARIGKRAYRVRFRDPQTAAQCGIMYTEGPFAAVWSMWTVGDRAPRWVATGYGDDFSDLVVAMSRSEAGALLGRLKRFCSGNDIALYRCVAWDGALRFNEGNSEVLPPNCAEVRLETTEGAE